ncbi:MAG: hypothetical protein ACT4QF_14110 [Sporichthyaceae bacterium]
MDLAPAPANAARRRISARWATAAVGALVLAVGAGSFIALAGGDDTGVPLERPIILNTLGTFKEPGQDTFSAAYLGLEDHGKHLEVLAVEARMSPNVEYIGAKAIWPRDVEKNGANPGNRFGYPAYEAHEAFGTVVPPEELDYVPKGWDSPADLFVMAGFRVVSGDVGAVNGIQVTYKFGGKTKRQFFAHAIVVCKAPNPCKGPDGATAYSQGILTQFGLVPEGTYS